MYRKSQLRIIFLLYPSLSFLILGVFSFSGGTGTLADPYNISTCIELQNMSSNLSAHYQLIQNIDCSVPPFNTDPWFSPIGNCTGTCSSGDPNDLAFTGSFNGNYFTISDLTIINTSGTGNRGWGLFGFVNNGTISNINLENIFVNVSDTDVGGLVGLSSFSSVSNSSSSGSVSGNDVVGGLVGLSSFSSVSNSSSSGSVSGNDVVGGLVGDSFFSSVSNSYSSSSVSGNDDVGGLVGDSSFSSVSNSYSSGSVSGNDSVGGLVGLNREDSNIFNSFTISNVSGINSSSTGGLVGINDGDFSGFGGLTTITNSFYYNSSGNPSRAIGFDDEGASVTSESNLSYFYDNTNQPFNGNWDSGVWNFTGNSLPFLQGQENPFSVSDSPVVSESTASLFTFGGILVSLMLVLGFFLF